jgi:hypothetical protein
MTVGQDLADVGHGVSNSITDPGRPGFRPVILSLSKGAQVPLSLSKRS